MSKGIAIRIIMFLLLGILVAGIIIYLLYTSATGTQLSEQNCRSRVITWCTGCNVAGWLPNVGEPGSDLISCAPQYFAPGEDWSSGVDCQDTPGQSTRSFCSSFIAVSARCTGSAVDCSTWDGDGPGCLAHGVCGCAWAAPSCNGGIIACDTFGSEATCTACGCTMG